MTTTCTCRGECGSPRCISAHMLGQRPCGVTAGNPHPVTGAHVRLVGGRCQLCHTAHFARQERFRRWRERLADSDGPNISLFALVDRGGRA